AYEGRLYNLCCPGCKRTIEQDPARYTSRVKSLAVEAFRFGFEPETIAVRQGDIVVIDLSSRDTRHGFYIKEYGINAQFGNDRTEKVSFIADRRGEFPILCSVYCGARHGRMKATLIVQ
ncbi:MAG TPA: hypothetical protein PK636_06425, partial [bacterium]|nr:hypothetical protein [bacterium]